MSQMKSSNRMKSPRVLTGLEEFGANPSRHMSAGERVGLLMNPASVGADYRSSRDVVFGAIGDQLKCIFGPQHGINADVQDNMIESDHATDPVLGIPVWSLYGESRTPTDEMLDGLDTVLVDIQDVGTRVYTFIWTLKLLMDGCADKGVRVVVLDRPNPIGGEMVEGNLLELRYRSFVGLEAIPMRHGLTIGELARWLVASGLSNCELKVVKMQGWQRWMHWPDTGLPWVMPSPNMPTYDTALVYPGGVLTEGTTASEGRGTTRPFEIMGGPWGSHGEVARELEGCGLDGVLFRPVTYEPTFHKWAGQLCFGVQSHVTDPLGFKPYLAGLAFLRTMWKLYRDEGFGWTPPPYEYEEVELPIHLLIGSSEVREAVELGVEIPEIENIWADELAGWVEESKSCHLY